MRPSAILTVGLILLFHPPMVMSAEKEEVLEKLIDKELFLPTLRNIFWGLLNEECQQHGSNHEILANDDNVPKTTDIDKVVLHESQLNLKFIQKMYGKPGPKQMQDAVDRYTEERKAIDDGKLTPTPLRAIMEIGGAIEKFYPGPADLSTERSKKAKVNELEQHTKEQAKEAISCLKGHTVQRPGKASAANVFPYA
eukprot:GHVU01021192.1.p1 GENE.GHVU01021192.1~~GHVU01021192.1.p1  ORF type:complete len:196 (-),score=29.96 GHVU01021192.1:326-913(-)